MSVNLKVMNALSPLGFDVAFGVYKGAKDKYIVFNFEDERADFFADDEPITDIVYLQIHFFAPRTFNFVNTKNQIRSALKNAGFSYPSIQTFYEDETDYNHLVFSTSIDVESEE